MYRRLLEEDLFRLMPKWMEGATVLAPVKQGSLFAFQPVTDPEQVDLNYRTNTRYPAKALFLPQSEVMFRVGQGQFSSTENEAENRVVFGIRPCDLRALRLLDAVFLNGEYADPYWKRKREMTALIALGCHEPGLECFCTTVGTGPFDGHGADALLTRVDSMYIAELYTEKGQLLFEGLPEATPSQRKAMQEIRESAAGKVPRPFTLDQIKDHLFTLFEKDFWPEVQQLCLGCGVCTYLCPTCHCFDIVDETQRSERVRNWDSCMFRLYSQEASGHNPRPTVKERLRQRLMHKYAYFPERFQEIGCTGCGRCVRFCPVNLDIRTIIRKVREECYAKSV